MNLVKLSKDHTSQTHTCSFIEGNKTHIYSHLCTNEH